MFCFKTHRLIGIACITACLGLLGITGCGGKKDKGDAKAGDKEAGGKKDDDKKDDGKKPPGEALKVKAVALAQEFVDDAKAAEAKYKDKNLIVEGEVETANKNFANGKVIVKGVKKSPKDVFTANLYCTPIAAETDKALQLFKGQAVKVRGTCVGASPLGGAFLADCDFELVGPSKKLMKKASELTEEHAKDKEAAVKNYQDREIIVSGVVSELFKTKTGFNSARLAGHGDWSVVCTMNDDDFKMLKKGQEVHIMGEGTFLDGKELKIDAAYLVSGK